MSNRSVLIKPASGNCNLRCKYCFYFDEVENREFGQGGFMSKETTDKLIEKTMNGATTANFAFQGGEPTMWGLSKFKYFIEKVRLENKNNIPTNYFIQTNGTLLNEEWCEFFLENKFLVGVSLDGPPDLHDKYRVYPNGKGSSGEVKKALMLLKEYNVDTNILITVNKSVAQNIERIYKYLMKNGFNYHQYIPCIDPIGAGGDMIYSLTPEIFGRFLIKLFDLWKKDILAGNYVSVRYFENLIAMVTGNRPEQCGFLGHCTNQYVVEADGSVYPCDFYVLDNLMLGDINTDEFSDFDKKRTEIRFIEQSLKVEDDCKKCKFYGLCRGGCRRERDDFAGNLHKNGLCSGYKMFFKYSLQEMSSIAKKAVTGQLKFKNQV